MASTVLKVGYQVVLVFVYTLVAYHVTKLAIIPFASRSANEGFRVVCRDIWRRLLSCIWPVRCMRRQSKSTMAKAIQEQMDEFRVHQCGRCAKMFANLLGCFMAVGSIYSQISIAESPVLGNVVRFSFYALVYLVLLLVAFDGLRLTKLRLDILYAGISLSMCLTVAQMEDDERFFLLLGANAIMRMALGTLYLDSAKSTPWNLAISTVTFWRYPYNSSVLKTAEHTVWYFAVTESFVCVGVSLGCSVVQAWLEGRFRLQMSVQSQKRATLRLAVLQCDAVFWLTPDLRLGRAAPQLAHMLFMSDSPNHLEGRQFQNYIATDSDRERFRNFLGRSVASPPEPDGLPEVLHVDLRDSTSRVFAVQVFHSWFVDDHDQVGHLIGVSESRPGAEEQDARAQEQRERREMAARAPPQLPAPALEPTLIGNPNNRAESAATAPAATGDVAQGETIGVAPSLMPLIPEDRAFAPISVCFNPGTCEILGATAGFATLVGPLVRNTRIQDIIMNVREFGVWIQNAGNYLIYYGGYDEPLTVRLARPTRKKSASIQYNANAHMVSAELGACPSEMGVQLAEGCNDEEHNMLCVVEFKHVEVHWPDQNKQKPTVASDAAGTPAPSSAANNSVAHLDNALLASREPPAGCADVGSPSGSDRAEIFVSVAL